MAGNGIKINRITNANIYLKGNTMLGKAEEIKLPEIKIIMQDHKALGMVGKIELPAGIDKMEGEIKWNSFYADAAEAWGNPFEFVALQCRSSVDTYDSQGRKEEVELVSYLNVAFTQTPLGTFKQHDNVEMPSKFTVYAIKQVFGGKEILDLDIMANIFIKDGKDLLGIYRKNIGG